MNAVLLDGTLVSDCVVRGKQTKVLAFTVETKQSNGDGKEYITHVPCVIFNPDQQLEDELTNGKGRYLLMQGRLNTNRNGEDDRPRNLEVVVFNKSLVIADRS